VASLPGPVKLVIEPGGRVLKMLKLTGLDKVFEQYDTDDAAIASF
jgi:hypothetical protein